MFLAPYVSVPRPWSAWADLDKEFDRVFEGLSGTDTPTGWEVHETPEAWAFTVLVPGLNADQIRIDATLDTLSLSGRRAVPVTEGYKVIRQERGDLHFARTFQFPGPIDADHVQAELKSGVLRVTVPKRSAPQPRLIKVQTPTA